MWPVFVEPVAAVAARCGRCAQGRPACAREGPPPQPPNQSPEPSHAHAPAGPSEAPDFWDCAVRLVTPTTPPTPHRQRRQTSHHSSHAPGGGGHHEGAPLPPGGSGSGGPSWPPVLEAVRTPTRCVDRHSAVLCCLHIDCPIALTLLNPSPTHHDDLNDHGDHDLNVYWRHRRHHAPSLHLRAGYSRRPAP